MKLIHGIAFALLTATLGTAVLAGFEYDPVLSPEMCVGFEQGPFTANKQVWLYIEELAPLYADEVEHTEDIKRLARAQGALKFRDMIKEEYLNDDLLLGDTEDLLRLSFTGDPDLEDPYAYQEAIEQKWPMLYFDDLTGRHFCSGVLIGPKHFLPGPGQLADLF